MVTTPVIIRSRVSWATGSTSSGIGAATSAATATARLAGLRRVLGPLLLGHLPDDQSAVLHLLLDLLELLLALLLGALLLTLHVESLSIASPMKTIRRTGSTRRRALSDAS